jgi:O-antigen ligase
LLWWSAGWPLAPILRVILVAGLSFKLEVNLFPVFKYNEGPQGLNISLILLVSLLLVGARALKTLSGDKPRERDFPLSFSLASAMIFLICTVSILDSSEQRLGFYGLWGLAATWLMCFVTAKEFGDRATLRIAVLTMAAAVGSNGLIALLQSTTGMFTELTLLGAAREESRLAIGEGEIPRVSALLGTANAFGWYLVTMLPVLIAMLAGRVEDFRGRKRRMQWLLGISTGLAVTALVLTYARGSWIAFGVSMLAFAALALRATPKAHRRRFVLQISGAALLVTLLCLPFAGRIYTRLTEDDKGAAYSRVPLMQVAQAMIAGNPWLGVGLGNYEAEMRRYDQTPERITDTFDWPVHNIFLYMTAEAGIPATLCFLALVAIALRRGFIALGSPDPLLRALAMGLIAGMIAYLMTGLKEPGSFGAPQLRPCFLFLGLLLALDRATRCEGEGMVTGERATSH